MRRKKDKGFSLVELIVVIAIMAVLVGIVAPQFIKYVEKSRQAKYTKEASEFLEAAKVSFTTYWVESESQNNARTCKIKDTGDICGRLTNYSVINPDVTNNSNVIKNFMQVLNISKTESKSRIPMANRVPGGNNDTTTMSMDKYAIFQILYDENLNMTIEYNRMGYFIRIEKDGSTSCEKLTDKNDYKFTKLQVKATGW